MWSLAHPSVLQKLFCNCIANFKSKYTNSKLLLNTNFDGLGNLGRPTSRSKNAFGGCV